MTTPPPLHPDATPTTIGALLDRTLGRHPEREAIVAAGERLTYRALGERVDRVAWGLHRLGVRRGDHVALWMQNRPEWVIVELAVTRLGAVLVPVNTRYTAAEAEYVLRQSDASTLIVVDRFLNIDFAGMVTQLCPELATAPSGGLVSARLPRLRRVVVLGETVPAGAVPFAAMADAAPDIAALRRLGDAVSVEDVAMIFYTSGTTAFPKGVMLAHGQITRNMFEARVIREELTSDDRLLVVAPFVHIVGGMNSVFAMLHVGGCLVLQDRFDPDGVLDVIARERVTRFYGPVTMFVDILASPALPHFDLGSLRRVMIFPGPFRVEFLQDVIDRLKLDGVSLGYGLTETTNGATFVSSWADGLERVATTVGRPRETIDIRVVDRETGRSQPVGTPGEIVVRAFTVMKGYYGKPRETSEAVDADGWLHTGDVGRFDADGYLYFDGRYKDMLKTSGFNVSCQEVEEVLGRHPAVLYASLVGIPDARDSEIGAAFVQLRPGATCTEDELRELCRTRLARFKVPRHVRFVDALPLSASGKVQKFVLRAALIKQLGLDA